MPKTEQERTDKSIETVFPPALKATRKAKGLTQQQAAELLRIGLRQYGNWERGDSVPSAEMLIRIYRVLGLSIYDLDIELPDRE